MRSIRLMASPSPVFTGVSAFTWARLSRLSAMLPFTVFRESTWKYRACACSFAVKMQSGVNRSPDVAFVRSRMRSKASDSASTQKAEAPTLNSPAMAGSAASAA